MTDPSPEEVEAVARAIWAKWSMVAGCKPWDQIGLLTQETFLALARAAIAAMPEREVKPLTAAVQGMADALSRRGAGGPWRLSGSPKAMAQLKAENAATSDVTVTKREDGSDQVVVG